MQRIITGIIKYNDLQRSDRCLGIRNAWDWANGIPFGDLIEHVLFFDYVHGLDRSPYYDLNEFHEAVFIDSQNAVHGQVQAVTVQAHFLDTVGETQTDRERERVETVPSWDRLKPPYVSP